MSLVEVNPRNGIKILSKKERSALKSTLAKIRKVLAIWTNWLTPASSLADLGLTVADIGAVGLNPGNTADLVIGLLDVVFEAWPLTKAARKGQAAARLWKA